MDMWIARMVRLWCEVVTPRRDERGDVPGWVLVTVMTAGLVVALWGIADDTLSQMLRDALASVR